MEIINQQKIQQLEPTQEELYRPSLYDLARQKREDRIPPPITRLLYVVYFSESSLQKVDIEQIIKQEVYLFVLINYLYKIKDSGDQSGSIVTGYLMLRGLFSMHLLESDSNYIQYWINNLYKEFNKEKGVYQIINIITFTEDNPTRIFDKWYCENLFQSGPQLSEMDKNDQQSIERVWDLYQSTCNSGIKYCGKSAKDKQTQKISNDIPLSLDDINMLLHKRFMSITEYFQLYVEEVQIELDGEMLYPQNPSLTRCLEFWDNGIIQK